MLAKRGVTSIKDIGFDQHSGLLPVLEELEAAGELPLRFHLRWNLCCSRLIFPPNSI